MVKKRGSFVVVVGPDGVGKTTVAKALLEAHPGPTGYFHFRPPIWQSLAERPAGAGYPPPSKGQAGGRRWLGWLRLARNFVRFWAGYLRNVRPALRGGALVVGDRWAYGYLVQPHALRFYGPSWLAAAALRALPHPDLVVNLSAPPEVVWQRKRELTDAQIRTELLAWELLPAQRLRTFQSVEDPRSVASAIFQELNQS
jgi:thymidylate kinase